MSKTEAKALKLCLAGDARALKKHLRKHRRLLDDIDSVCDDAGYTLLMNATEQGHVSVCKTLLKLGARLNERHRSSGDTAVHLAARANLPDVLFLFRQHDERERRAMQSPPKKSCMRRRNHAGKTPHDLLDEAEQRALLAQTTARSTSDEKQIEHVKRLVEDRLSEDDDEKLFKEKLLSVCVSRTTDFFFLLLLLIMLLDINSGITRCCG